MRDRMLGTIVALATLVTVFTELPHWRAALARAAERMPTARSVRERNEERVIVTQILDALASTPSEAIALVLPAPPGPGDDVTYLVYRLRVKLYPRPLDVAFLDAGTWHR